jgi:hypothetical protein
VRDNSNHTLASQIAKKRNGIVPDPFFKLPPFSIPSVFFPEFV